MAVLVYVNKYVELMAGIDLNKQLKYCTAMIEAEKEGEEIVKVVDNDPDAMNLNYDEFVEIMDIVSEYDISKVVVYQVDAIADTIEEFVDIIEELKKRNISLVSVSDSFDSSLSEGELIKKILTLSPQF